MVESTTVTHSSADWWDLLPPLACISSERHQGSWQSGVNGIAKVPKRKVFRSGIRTLDPSPVQRSNPLGHRVPPTRPPRPLTRPPRPLTRPPCLLTRPSRLLTRPPCPLTRPPRPLTRPPRLLTQSGPHSAIAHPPLGHIMPPHSATSSLKELTLRLTLTLIRQTNYFGSDSRKSTY